ncbi:cholesterol transport system auxiliary component [Variovorax sp. OK605]|jgi:cholesterol transport system auxiliary component|uniref:ABC-type transport auxiliary lipoprotein family protein n=1 Tax=unclassified Variovorax TaxID=663243 RepID=UPI0008AC0040|nr:MULTISPECIES: ABC-type transport auxiliary lipoprotein family protein [unclassified Variovorax]SEJ87763.1 cholesterol transport system auxiliary component [Variovorax sp. OK202]SFD03824.1 cholesterol transport system auxiliary component [Variovorax sp. OK212]SFP15157.1 cholesterol transport system auxiliary component [Variovorax sp. OK605]
MNTIRSLTTPLALGLVLLAAGCGALPDKPQRATLYDFGPGVPAASATGTTVANAAPATLPTLALAEFEANARLDGTQILYRLGYADVNELRPYGQSRWSLPPAQLLRQRLRDTLSERRMVLGPEESATIARGKGEVPDMLRISLEEFSHYFDSASASTGLVRLRATLVRSSTGGDRVLGQRLFTVRRPAPSADAPGGVKALISASDGAVAEVVQWVDQLQRQQPRQ